MVIDGDHMTQKKMAPFYNVFEEVGQALCFIKTGWISFIIPLKIREGLKVQNLFFFSLFKCLFSTFRVVLQFVKRPYLKTSECGRVCLKEHIT